MVSSVHSERHVFVCNILCSIPCDSPDWRPALEVPFADKDDVWAWVIFQLQWRHPLAEAAVWLWLRRVRRHRSVGSSGGRTAVTVGGSVEAVGRVGLSPRAAPVPLQHGAERGRIGRGRRGEGSHPLERRDLPHTFLVCRTANWNTNEISRN